MDGHTHGPNCGCKDYLSLEEGDDLYGVVELDKVQCLNEATANSGRKVFKLRDNRLDEEDDVESDVDPELLFIVPFNQNVKLKSINIRAKSEDLAPEKLKLFINEENVDFSIIEDSTPVQEVGLVSNLGAEIEYALKIAKLQSVSKVILHISAEDKDSIGITYIGMKGVRTNVKRGVVIATYESKPQLKDHQVNSENEVAHKFGGGY